MWCVVVCDLETSRMGAPYIHDISRLRVKASRQMYLPKIWWKIGTTKLQMTARVRRNIIKFLIYYICSLAFFSLCFYLFIYLFNKLLICYVFIVEDISAAMNNIAYSSTTQFYVSFPSSYYRFFTSLKKIESTYSGKMSYKNLYSNTFLTL